MHRGQVHRFFVCALSWPRFRIDIADQRELGQKLMHVFELTRKYGELVEVFAAQLVVCKVHFRVVVVNRFHDRCDHFRWRIRLPARRDFI